MRSCVYLRLVALMGDRVRNLLQVVVHLVTASLQVLLGREHFAQLLDGVLKLRLQLILKREEGLNS